MLPSSQNVFSRIKDIYANGANDSTSSNNVFSRIKDIYNPQLTGQVWPDFKTIASPIAKERNFPLNVLLGQAALESARGTAAPGNNYFGIKALSGQDSTNQNTQEYGPNGYYGENDAFAAYPTPQDNVKAYIDLVTSFPGVKEALASGDSLAVLKAIKAAGYATSPTYVEDVASTPEFQGDGQ